MQRQRTSVAAVTLACGLATAMLAGCSSGTPSARSALGDVDKATVDTNTSRGTITVETGRADTANPNRRTQQAEFDYKANRARLKNEGTSASETLLIGDDLYTSVPESISGKISGGKPWLKRSRVAPGNGPIEQFLQPTDPIALLRAVQRVSTGGEVAGHEKIRGTDTTRYRLKVDPGRLPDLEPDPARRAALTERLKDNPGASLAVDLWVDGSGRARRIVTKIDLAAFAAATPATTAPGQPAPAPGVVTVTTELFDPGARLDIQPPPADQVSDGPKPG